MQIALNSGSTSMDFATEFCPTITTLCPGDMLREFVKAWTLEHIYLFSMTAQGGPSLLLLYSKSLVAHGDHGHHGDVNDYFSD